MYSDRGGLWSPEAGGPDRSRTWENVHDDAGRVEQLAYRHDLMTTAECGPSPWTDRYVL